MYIEKSLFTSRGPATVLYDGRWSVVYGPLQHEEPPPEVAVPSESVGPPVASTTSSRQAAIVVGRACATVWPRLAATVVNSVQQTTAAVQANMTASEMNNFNAMLACCVARVKRVQVRPVSLAFCRRDGGVRITVDGREPRTI